MKPSNKAFHHCLNRLIIILLIMMLGIQPISVSASRSIHTRHRAQTTTVKFLTLPFTDPGVKITNAWLAMGLANQYPCLYYTPACHHKGIDYTKHDAYGKPISFTVLASAAGTASCYPKGSTSVYGNYIDLNHGNGLVTRYAHLLACEFTTKKVIRGDYLGKAGNTSSTKGLGIHLHFELRVSGISKDPYGLYTTKDKYPQPGKAFSGISPSNHYWRNYPPRYPIAPTVPTSLKASDGLYTDKVVVTWTTVPDTSRYELWRNTISSSTTSVRISTNALSGYSDISILAGKTYFYWIKACNYIGCSGLSQFDYGYRQAITPPPSLTPTLTLTSPPTFTSTATFTPTNIFSATFTPTAIEDVPSETPTPTNTPAVPTDTPTSTATSTPTEVVLPFTDTPTATNTVTPISTPLPFVLQPTLTPPYSGNMCDQNGIRGHAWYPITDANGNKIAYMTLNASTSAESTNSATWRPNFSMAGSYKVEVWIPNHPVIYWQCLGKTISWDTEKARYQLYYQGGNTTKIINIAPLADAWVNLGTYYFDKGTSGYITLSDLTGEALATRTIPFSAIRFTYMSP